MVKHQLNIGIKYQLNIRQYWFVSRQELEGWFYNGGWKIFKGSSHSWQRGTNPPTLWRPHLYCLPLPFFKFCPPSPLCPPLPCCLQSLPLLFFLLLCFFGWMSDYAPFYGWGSTASRLQPLRGWSLLFTIQFPEISKFPYTFFVISISIFRVNVKGCSVNLRF